MASEEDWLLSSDDEDIEISGSDSEVAISEDEISDEDILAAARQWYPLSQDTPSPPPFAFIEAPGINNIDVQDYNCLDFFELFFDNQLFQRIADETNRYANSRVRGRANTSWYNTNQNEIRTFVAVVLLQSIVRKPEYRHYWTKNPLLYTPFFLECMTGKRFETIKQFLHFSNNDEFDPANHPCPKLNKIWPIYEELNRKFHESITPEKLVTIDESLLLYKGRLGWVQYIPLKRSRFGIKTFLLCESKSGYVYNFIIYTGKNTVLDREFSDLPMSSQVVMTLMKPLLNKGYCLTMDNFYNSPQLADLLIGKKTDVYGTLRVSRKEVPKELKNKKLKKGEIIGFQRGKVAVMKWKDKKDVFLISTIHSISKVEIETRRGRTEKPQLVLDYNCTMGGVDRVDQHLSSYVVPRKRGKKYYKKIFFHLLDLAMWNAFVLYQKSGGVMDSLDFRLEVIKLIIEKYKVTSTSRSGRPSVVPTPLRLSARHFPAFIPPTEKKENPTRQCYICSKKKDANGKKIRKETRYMCSNCDVPLCVIPCFRIYHTETNID